MAVDQLEAEAVAILQSLNEKDLRDKVILPFFKHRGWEVYVAHGPKEIRHGCDLLLAGNAFGENFLIGVQVKSVKDIRTYAHVVRDIRERALAALFLRYGNKGDRALAKYYWITTGVATEDGRHLIWEELLASDLIGGRIEIWDVHDFYRELQVGGAVRDITPLRRVGAESQIRRHKEDKRGTSAAFWCYQAFRHYLVSDKPNLVRAAECIEEGLDCLAGDPEGLIHYHRVWRRTFEMWLFLLRSNLHLPASIKSVDDFLVTPWAKGLIERSPGIGSAAMLLTDFDKIVRQLEQLERHYANGPSGLATLQICRLLLRFGFAPEGNIRARLDRACEELEEGQIDGGPWEAIDDQCSLCTGTLVSCFSLARERDKLGKSVDWLVSLKNFRYSHIQPTYINVGPGEHALHYASAALLGLLDFNNGQNKVDVEPVIRVFFESDELDPAGFYLEWMRYRNIDRYEVSRFILSSFIHYYLMGNRLSQEREECLMAAIRALVGQLKLECGGNVSPWVFFGTRTNLASFSLGMLLGMEEAAEFASGTASSLHRRAQRAVSGSKVQTWDSNLDRTVVFLEAYLDYWESILKLEDEGRLIESFLPS